MPLPLFSPIDPGPYLEQLPVLVQALMAVGVLLGVVLWLLGRSIARTSVTTCGIVLGSMAGVAAAQLAGGAWVVVWMIAGAVIGIILALVLFRIWMGVTLAVLLAMVVPAASLGWRGTPPPEVVRAGEILDERQRLDQVATKQGLQTVIRDGYERQTRHIRQWWANLGQSARTAVLVMAGLSALAGLAIGLVKPYVGAALQSSVVGALLMLWGGTGLLRTHAPAQADWLPTGPRGQIVLLGLITAAGVIVQCALWRKRADK